MKHLIDVFKLNRFLKEVDLSGKLFRKLTQLFSNINYFYHKANSLSDDDGLLLIESIEDHMLSKLNLSQNTLAEKSGNAIGKWLGNFNFYV
jgi:hypothetical protein